MNPNFFTFLHVYRTGGSSSSSDSDSLSDKENSEDEVVYHQSDLPLLFLGQEIVRQREGGDAANIAHIDSSKMRCERPVVILLMKRKNHVATALPTNMMDWRQVLFMCNTYATIYHCIAY